jgi:hypothetical protein
MVDALSDCGADAASVGSSPPCGNAGPSPWREDAQAEGGSSLFGTSGLLPAPSSPQGRAECETPLHTPERQQRSSMPAESEVKVGNPLTAFKQLDTQKQQFLDSHEEIKDLGSKTNTQPNDLGIGFLSRVGSGLQLETNRSIAVK